MSRPGELGELGSLNASSYCPTDEGANISLAFLKFEGARGLLLAPPTDLENWVSMALSFSEAWFSFSGESHLAP